MKKKRLFIIDAMAMAFRSYHAFVARPLTTPEGLPISAVFGSALFIMRLIERERPDYLLIATDSKEKTFRHEIYPEYKANRGEMPEDLSIQIPELFILFDVMQLRLLKQPGLEADDLIGSIVTQYSKDDLECYIVSGDKDFMQLMNSNTYMYAPKKGGETKIIDEQGVHEKFGCRPDQVIDFLALMGDASDNVPGVRGIGEKGAAKLISQFETLDGIYQNLESITNKRHLSGLTKCKEMAYLSQKLVTIKNDIKIDYTLEDFSFDSMTSLASQPLLRFFEEMGFKGLSDRIRNIIDASPKKASTGTANAINDANHPGKTAPSVGSATSDPGHANSKNTAINSLDSATDKKKDEIETKNNSTKKATKEFEFIKDKNVTYKIANTRDSLDEFIRELKSASLFSFDTETTGLNIKVDTPIGLSFSTRKNTGWYVPVIDKHLEDISSREVLEAIQPILANKISTKVAHNLKYDLQILANANIEVCPASLAESNSESEGALTSSSLKGSLEDTMIAAFLVDASDRFGLDHCSEKYLGKTKIPTEALIGKKEKIAMSDVPLDLLSYYACEDADCCLQLHKILQPLLAEKSLETVYRDIDMPLVPVLARMEQEGIFVDADELSTISDSLDKTAKELELDIYAAAGEKFNINSTKQLQTIIFEKLQIHTSLGIKRIKKTKTGLSTDVSVMEKLSEHPLPRLIIDYRTVSKLKNTYVDTLPQLIEPSSDRIHTSFHQTGAQTGRLSSSKPNLQNIPIRTKMGKEIRRAFRAMTPDHSIMSADYSQIELRLLAHLSGDTNLRKAFTSGEDIHKSTAATMFKKTLEDVTDTDRSRAKAINYGLIYGMGPQRLARTTGVSLKEAKDFIKSYFESFPEIRNYIDKSIDTARKLGFSTTMTGRQRPIDGLDESGGLTAVNAQNIAVNSPIQGSAADLIKIAMINIQNRLDQSKMKAKMLLQVHDELVFECPDSETETLAKLVRDCMEHAMTLEVPLTVDIGQGRDWLEAH